MGNIEVKKCYGRKILYSSYTQRELNKQIIMDILNKVFPIHLANFKEIDYLETLVNMKLLIRWTNGNWYYNWDMYRNITVGKSILSINISGEYDSTTFPEAFAIFEYTKTTD